MADQIGAEEQAEAIAEFLTNPGKYEITDQELNELLNDLCDKGQLTPEEIRSYGAESLLNNLENARSGDELKPPLNHTISQEEELEQDINNARKELDMEL